MSTELHQSLLDQVAKDLCIRETAASLKRSKPRLGNKFTVRGGRRGWAELRQRHWR